MNKVIAKATRANYKQISLIANNFMKMFERFAKEECKYHREICTCYHKDNDYLISVIGGPPSCKPNICPYMR